MKQLASLFLLTSFVTISSYATIRTVSNDPQNPAQFTTIQAAVDAAVAGDTIYVNVSPTDYSENVSLTKRVILIGGGYKSSSQLNYKTYLSGGIYMSVSGANDPSGTVICGFEVSQIAGVLPINNIRIFRNLIRGGVSVYGNNWNIYNNLIPSAISMSSGTGTTNLFIQNNLFGIGGFISSSITVSSIIIDHNVFQSSFVKLNNVKFATITNNIFASGSSDFVFDNGCTSNNFNNNLSTTTNVSVTAPTNSFASGPNTEAGNFVGVNPLFVNVTDLTLYAAINNYRLQSTSPVKNAGTDGTDLGIYGGSYPFPSGGAPGSGFDTSALPPIPQVTGVNIQNGTLAPGAQLKVTIQATTNN
jgi:hypothetical protein